MYLRTCNESKTMIFVKAVLLNFWSTALFCWKKKISPYLSPLGVVVSLPVIPKLNVVELTVDTDVDAVEFFTSS